MNQKFHNKRQIVYLTNQKYFSVHMFKIELEEKSFKIKFQALSVKIQ